MEGIREKAVSIISKLINYSSFLHLKKVVNMSINIQRAERNTDHYRINTPAHVAPGSYDPIKGAREEREK